LKELENKRKNLQYKFDIAFRLKQNYFKKSIQELCIEEAELLRIAWNNYCERENRRIEKELKK